MPILIAHRGNIEGPNPKWENHPDYIQEALDAGYDVEIDLWRKGYGPMRLGHDEPQYDLPYKLAWKPGMWLHCKKHLCPQNCTVLGGQAV